MNRGFGAGDVCFSADEPSTVTVVFDECASSCAEIEYAYCEVTVEGDTIVVVGDSSFTTYPERECSSDCMEVSATCEMSTALEPGTYTLDHHEVQTEVTLPQDTCVEL